MEQASTKRPYFDFDGIDPMKMPAPLGDRYLMEVQEFDDTLLSSRLYLPATTEAKAGWVPAIIIACGNGLCLDRPPVPLIMPSDFEKEFGRNITHLAHNGKVLTDEQKDNLRKEMILKSLSPLTPHQNEVAMLMLAPQYVPMMLIPGQEIIVERYSGRTYEMLGRQFRTMAQVDCLQPTGRFFRWDNEEGWIERDLEAERAAAEAAQAAKGKILRP